MGQSIRYQGWEIKRNGEKGRNIERNHRKDGKIREGQGVCRRIYINNARGGTVTDTHTQIKNYITV